MNGPLYKSQLQLYLWDSILYFFSILCMSMFILDDRLNRLSQMIPVSYKCYYSSHMISFSCSLPVGFVALPSILSYSKSDLFDSSQETYLVRSHQHVWDHCHVRKFSLLPSYFLRVPSVTAISPTPFALMQPPLNPLPCRCFTSLRCAIIVLSLPFPSQMCWTPSAPNKFVFDFICRVSRQISSGFLSSTLEKFDHEVFAAWSQLYIHFWPIFSM